MVLELSSKIDLLQFFSNVEALTNAIILLSLGTLHRSPH